MTTWFEMTNEESLALWDRHNWRWVVENALLNAALCRYLPVDKRMLALQTINLYSQNGVIRSDGVPDFIARTIVDMTAEPMLKLGWLARRRAKREADYISERLTAAINVLATISQFQSPESIELSEAFDFGGTKKTEKLLS